ncbi:unnamed protein product [Penicillium nalgiovense]|uniref:Uncharacterized protein n=1 Tax=Penicillium nalgiovense TaxID=60175 RepID=A0A9W4HCU6_PENNA|nr:unnamed protein product [Penicillium nalgiovense]CAG7939831.1 unnamed protein product [Penicillium nalgiovense]CAG7949221.1 unnamed protein product [Penicillium nalgiovense]CAG7952249.1 unnamed protein product [Penicillium nalgiovense]CAG7953367.1 unnamed protein product [Penicillium nalgiovense]
MDNVNERAMREHWDSSLLGGQFWQDVTRRADELARNETQALTVRIPTQSPSKDPVQTTVTGSSEQSPKKKSRFQLSQLASFNNLRLRNTAQPSPTGTETTNSPGKSPGKSEKSSKKSSLRLPKLASFKSLSLKRRGPILASTEGIVEVQKPTRPSILSPSTFLPPDSPLPPIPPPPRPAFRSPYKGPSAPKLEIAPPDPSDSHPFPRAPNQLSVISFQEWLERESDPRPETVPTPHPDHSSRISLLAHLNNGGNWDDIPRTKSVLELNMFFDVRKVSPESFVDPNDDQNIDKSAVTEDVMVDKAMMTGPNIKSSVKNKIAMVDKATMTDFDFEDFVTDKVIMVDKVTMTDFDIESSATDKATTAELDIIKGSATDDLPTDKGTTETDVNMESATKEPTTGDHLATDKATAKKDENTKSVGTNVPISKESAAGQVATEQAGINTKCATENEASNNNLATDGFMMDLNSESSVTISLGTNTKSAKGKAAVHDWDLDGPSAMSEEDAAEPEDEIQITLLTLEQMRPLTQFRNLRVLKLVGMMKSYQPVIWQVVWLNPQLVTLELEMAVGLDIENPVGPGGWKPITKGWVMNVKSWAPPVYYGQGDGEISTKVGYGEYLDKYCIEKAKVLALSTGFPVPPYLPIKRLTLTGFAVDGDAFVMWFRNLEEVHFKKDCVDCGFWLSRAQRDVRVRHSDQFGVARGEAGPSSASSIKLGEERLAELTAAVRGLRA